MKQNISPGKKIICLNRKAGFNYFFLELLEAGISLKGSEVKSLRDGKGSIADSYAVDINGVTELAMMKSDVMSGIDKIKICTSYEQYGKEISRMPFSLNSGTDISISVPRIMTVAKILVAIFQYSGTWSSTNW